MSDSIYVAIAGVVATLIASLFSVITVIINKTMKLKAADKITDVKVELKNQELSDTEALVNSAIQGIPDGLDADEYFNRLKKALLEVSYIQIKNPVRSDSDKALSDLLETHHQQALQQSTIQFWFSLISSIIGFVFIIIMVALTPKETAWYEFILKILPGTIIEAVSALFFSQARETRDRATRFFRELNYERQISKSVTIADSIEDMATQSKVKADIARHIVGIHESDRE